MQTGPGRMKRVDESSLAYRYAKNDGLPKTNILSIVMMYCRLNWKRRLRFNNGILSRVLNPKSSEHIPKTFERVLLMCCELSRLELPKFEEMFSIQSCNKAFVSCSHRGTATILTIGARKKRQKCFSYMELL